VGAGLERGAFGVIGLETAAAAVMTWLGTKPDVLFDRMAIAPARIGGFARHGRLPAVGSPANLVVFDPAAEWVPSRFHSRSSNCPWVGRTVRGRVRATIFEGAISYQDGS
jgi:dihydroorotase